MSDSQKQIDKIETDGLPDDALLSRLGDAFVPQRKEFEATLLSRLTTEKKRKPSGTSPKSAVRHAWRGQWIYGTAVACLALVAGIYFTGVFESEKLAAKVMVVLGDVKVSHDLRETPNLSPGTEIQSGADGLASLKLQDSSIVRLAEDTSLSIGESRTIDLNRGKIFAHVSKTGTGSRFTVKTPVADVVVLGTKFEVVSDTNQTQVTVTEGQVRIEWPGPDGTKRHEILKESETVTIQRAAATATIHKTSEPLPKWVEKLIKQELMVGHFPSRSLNLLNQSQ